MHEISWIFKEPNIIKNLIKFYKKLSFISTLISFFSVISETLPSASKNLIKFSMTINALLTLIASLRWWRLLLPYNVSKFHLFMRSHSPTHKFSHIQTRVPVHRRDLHRNVIWYEVSHCSIVYTLENSFHCPTFILSHWVLVHGKPKIMFNIWRSKKPHNGAGVWGKVNFYIFPSVRAKCAQYIRQHRRIKRKASK